MATETRICQNCKASFVIDASDFAFYEKINVPPPTFCPDCRLQRRLAWRNERTLYRGRCALCGKNSLSMYSPEFGVTTFCPECWDSDRWDPLSFGSDYDFSRPFFEQYANLLRRVPRKMLQKVNAVNCEFANFVEGGKNVYMGFSVVYGSEDVMYAKNVDRSSYIVDSFDVSDSQTCFWNVNGNRNYHSVFLFDCRNCIDSAFLYDCADCTNCLLSTNLRKKSFYIRNEPFSREAYFEKLRAMDFGSASFFNKSVEDFFALKRSALHKYAANTNCVDCIGNELRDSKRALYAFSGYDFENVKYAFRSLSMKDAMDITNAAKSELFYEFMAGGAVFSRLVRFSSACTAGLDDVHYAESCWSSSNLFGCSSLRDKHHCILNRQYTKEEYEALVPRIIEHMNARPYLGKKGREYRYGEFPPVEIALFSYNETIAQEYFPLSKEEATKQGYRWRDPDPKGYQVTKTPDQLPDHIRDVDDSILNEVIGCAHSTGSTSSPQAGSGQAHGGKCNHQCTTAFKIIKEELEFYREMSLPLPRLCPNCRHYERLAQRNPLKLWHRKCRCGGARSENGVYTNTAKHPHGDQPCPNEFQTSYSPERAEIVYCEACYQNEVS